MFKLNIGVVILLLFIHHEVNALKATAVLYKDNSDVSNGTITFVQNNANDPVTVTGTISGVSPNSRRGFHIHAYGVSEPFPNCTQAGVHYDPYHSPHGFPTANISFRHVGDLGNVLSDGFGMVNVYIEDSIIQLFPGTNSIVNRSVVVHGEPDDGGVTNTSLSNTTGNAGTRIFCGLIKLSLDDPTTTTTPSIGSGTSSMIGTMSLFMTMIYTYVFFY